MQSYHIALAVAAILTLSVSWKTQRAWLWIGALVLSFGASVFYLRLYEHLESMNLLAIFFPEYFGRPIVPLETEWLPPSIIAAVCDVLVCIALHMFGREAWETKWLYRLMLGSVAVNILYATGVILGFPPIPDQDTLGIILEIINYLALLLIGFTGITDLLKAYHGHSGIGAALARFLETGRAYLHRPARRKTFWER